MCMSPKEIQGLCGDGMEVPASVAVAPPGCFTYGLQLQCGDVIAWTGDVSVLVGASSRWQCLITFFKRCEVSTSTSSVVRRGSLFCTTFSVKAGYHFSFTSQSAAVR